MVEQTRLQASQNGYKGHVTRLYNKIDKLVDREFDEYTTTSLSSVIEQLTRKVEITQIDEHLLKTFDNASELQLAVLDAKELHEDIDCQNPTIYVTGFAKRGLPHTSNFIKLKDHNFVIKIYMKLKLTPAIKLCWCFLLTKFQVYSFYQYEITNLQSL